MRLFLISMIVVAPAAWAQHCHSPGSAAATAEAIGASLQLSTASSQTTTSIADLAKRESACRFDADCHQSYECLANQCVQRSASGVPASQRQQQVELFLRSRAVELREELALGRGPVIDGLAGAQGKPPAALRKVIKAHHAELRAVIGDGSDPAWSARFLSKLDALG